MSLPPCTRLGPYEIESPLGAGGMGEVYKAVDTRLGRTVAVKILPAQVAGREDIRQRFEREARAVSSLNHPHICGLYDVGNDGGLHYFVMEYLDGESLEKRLERGALPVEEALRSAVQVAGALDAAHRAGVVHRDLKPANVMLTKAGAKLLDFGLAKVKDAGTAVAAATVLTSLPTETRALTTEGTIMGTFQYMAPEQLEGGEAGPRTDIFAFGAVLHEMLTGRRAFAGKSHASLIVAIMSVDPAPVSTAQPLTPPALDRVIRRCLAKNPDDRWQSARDLADELRWIAESGSQAGVPAAVGIRRRGRERSLWIAAAALVPILAASLFFNVRHLTEMPLEQPQIRFSIPKPNNLEFTTISAPVLSPDGTRMAFAAQDRIYLRSLNAFTTQPLPGTEGGYAPFFSPDGRSLGFGTRESMKRVDVVAGGVQTICSIRVAIASPLAWSREGLILFSNESGPIYAVPASGGTPREVTHLEPKQNERSHGWASFLPDGRHFIYDTVDSTQSAYTVYAASLDDPHLHKRILVGTGVALYSPTGHLLFIRDDNLLAQKLNQRRLELEGEPVLVAEQIGGANGIAGMAFSVAANGTLAWRPGVASRISQLTWFDRAGRSLGTLGQPAEIANPVLSPDGKRALVTIRDAVSRTRDIWLYDLQRSTASKITFDPAEDFNPAWSPDGEWVAFSSNRKGHKDIYRKRADGAGAEEELLVSNLEKNVESWSPDGKYILFNQSEGTGPADVYLLPLQGERKPIAFAATRFYESEGQISPNGKWIAYRSNESGPAQIYVQSVPGSGLGGKWQVSPSGALSPQWRADGKEMFFASQRRLFAVPVKADGSTFEAGRPEALFAFQPGPSLRNHYYASPDGQRFLLAVPPAAGTDQFNVLLNFTANLRQ